MHYIEHGTVICGQVIEVHKRTVVGRLKADSNTVDPIVLGH